jgi:drug/metabolite transporter (DMT)-like permease
LPDTRKPRRIATAALLYAAAIWGFTFFFVKDALEYVGPVAMVGYRFLLAALLIMAWLVWRRRPLFRYFRHGLLLGIVLWVLYVAQTVGLGLTTASNSGFITGLFIVFVPLVNWLAYRRRTGWQQVAAVLLALVGLYILTGGLAEINWGDILTLLVAVTYAIHVIYAGRCMELRLNPWVLNFQQMLVLGLLALASVPLEALAVSGSLSWELVAAHYGVAGPEGWLMILFLAIFPTITAYAAQLFGQQHVDETRAALLFTMEPVFAAVFAWWLGGEEFIPGRALGGGLMVLAMVLSEYRFRRFKAKP